MVMHGVHVPCCLVLFASYAQKRYLALRAWLNDFNDKEAARFAASLGACKLNFAEACILVLCAVLSVKSEVSCTPTRVAACLLTSARSRHPYPLPPPSPLPPVPSDDTGITEGSDLGMEQDDDRSAAPFSPPPPSSAPPTYVLALARSTFMHVVPREASLQY